MTNHERLLELIDVFYAETDDEHGLTLQELKGKLEARVPGSKVNLGTLTNDIEFLQDRSVRSHLTKKKPADTLYIIKPESPNGPRRYSYPRNEFDAHEIRVLMDAVASARFLTTHDTRKLIDKIRGLTSRRIAEQMSSEIHIDETVKAKNKNVKFYLNTIHQAIAEHVKITFQYGKYTVSKAWELLHDGQIYRLSPYAVVWNSDYYYVVGEQDGENKVKTFRVDRMHLVDKTDEKYIPADFDVPDYLSKMFNMYPGSVDLVRIQFDNSLVNVVIDRFGTDVPMAPVDDKTFSIRIHAAVNEGLVRWLLMWGGDAKVLAPESLVNRMREETRRATSMYD